MATAHCIDLPSPPRYSSPSPAPLYTCEPACDEQRLQLSPLIHTSLPTSSFVRKSGQVTVLLHNQSDNAELPTYDRNGLISGVVCLDDSDSVIAVALQIECRIDSAHVEGGSSSRKILHQQHSLWKAQTRGDLCPAQLSFAYLLPATYQKQATSYYLPPTYRAEFAGTFDLSINCQYTLSIVVTTACLLFRVWTTSRRMCIPFNHRPRRQVDQPIVQSSLFFESVKIKPEAWHQSSAVMQPHSFFQREPIYCEFFIPTPRIYGLSDTIPFHVQLTSTASSLHELFPLPVDCTLAANADSHIPYKSEDESSSKLAPIHVFLMRQVCVEVRGRIMAREAVIGKGTLSPVPPTISMLNSMQSGYQNENICWDGEVRCNSDVHVGGFATDSVAVKDFVVLSLISPAPQSVWPKFRHTVAVRFVTDSWAVM